VKTLHATIATYDRSSSPVTMTMRVIACKLPRHRIPAACARLTGIWAAYIVAATSWLAKPGGLTVAEVLACGRPLLVTAIFADRKASTSGFLERVVSEIYRRSGAQRVRPGLSRTRQNASSTTPGAAVETVPSRLRGVRELANASIDTMERRQVEKRMATDDLPTARCRRWRHASTLPRAASAS
jgi:hypothetical protein